MFAMHAASWLVKGTGTPLAYMFIHGGYGGSVMEIGGVNNPEPNCIV